MLARQRGRVAVRLCARELSAESGDSESSPSSSSTPPPSLPINDSPRPQGPDAGTMGFVGSDKMSISFTCGVCDTRITKSFHRQSYEKGVVVIKCPGCEKRHVIADNLGYFSAITGGRTNIEQIAEDKGEQVIRGTSDDEL